MLHRAKEDLKDDEANVVSASWHTGEHRDQLAEVALDPLYCMVAFSTISHVQNVLDGHCPHNEAAPVGHGAV